MRSARTIDSSATPSDSRAPTSTRDSTSRPRASLPSRNQGSWSRVLVGARLSLGVALLSTVLALLIGAFVGAAAGYAGGWVDATLMRVADLVIVLPGIYVVLALRGVLPLVLTTTQVFTALVGVLALVGWPSVARGVRGIILVEGRSEYAEAARALGAGSWRVIARHLLPATRGFLGVQATVLVPAFIM